MEEIFWNIFDEQLYRSFRIYSFENFQSEDVYCLGFFFVTVTYSLILLCLKKKLPDMKIQEKLVACTNILHMVSRNQKYIY